MRALNRCQLKGTIIQSGKQVSESQEVVKFELSFGDSKSVSCVVQNLNGSKVKSCGYISEKCLLSRRKFP